MAQGEETLSLLFLVRGLSKEGRVCIRHHGAAWTVVVVSLSAAALFQKDSCGGWSKRYPSVTLDYQQTLNWSPMPMEHRRENTACSLPKLWLSLEDTLGRGGVSMGTGHLFWVHETKFKSGTTQITPLRGGWKLAGGDSTAGEKLPCVAALKRLWSGLTEALAGGFASVRRESEPCKVCGVRPIVSPGIHKGAQRHCMPVTDNHGLLFIMSCYNTLYCDFYIVSP